MKKETQIKKAQHKILDAAGYIVFAVTVMVAPVLIGDSFLSSLFFIIAAFTVFPPLAKQKPVFKGKSAVIIILFIILCIVGLLSLPSVET